MTHKRCPSALAIWMSQYPFTHHAGLNFFSTIDFCKAMFQLKKWRRDLAIKEHLQIAYMGVINHKPMTHFHLLLMGRSNRTGKTLNDISAKQWRRYEMLWRGSAKITPIDGSQGRQKVAGYIVDQNMPWGHYENLPEFNKKLLKKSLAMAA